MANFPSGPAPVVRSVFPVAQETVTVIGSQRSGLPSTTTLPNNPEPAATPPGELAIYPMYPRSWMESGLVSVPVPPPVGTPCPKAESVKNTRKEKPRRRGNADFGFIASPTNPHYRAIVTVIPGYSGGDARWSTLLGTAVLWEVVCTEPPSRPACEPRH